MDKAEIASLKQQVAKLKTGEAVSFLYFYDKKSRSDLTKRRQLFIVDRSKFKAADLKRTRSRSAQSLCSGRSTAAPQSRFASSSPAPVMPRCSARLSSPLAQRSPPSSPLGCSHRRRAGQRTGRRSRPLAEPLCPRSGRPDPPTAAATAPGSSARARRRPARPAAVDRTWAAACR